MLKRLSTFAVALVSCGVSVSQADARLTYELTGSDSRKTEKVFAISEFFVRIDDPSKAGRYLLFQAGKFFPLYSVDETKRTYTRLTPAVTPRLGPVSRSERGTAPSNGKSEKPADLEGADQQQASQGQVGAADNADKTSDAAPAEPADSEGSAEIEPATAVSAKRAAQPSPDVAASKPPGGKTSRTATSPAPTAEPQGVRGVSTPTLKPSKKMRSVAGIRCRVVQELLDGEPVMEHCMANSAGLGLTKREVITLSRLFGMARDRTFGWLGIGSGDEKFVSVQSRDLRNDSMLRLTSVSTEPLPVGYLRIPKTFKLVEPEAQSNPSAASSTALE